MSSFSSFIRMKSRNRESYLPIKFEFHAIDDEWFIGILTENCPIQDIIRNLRYLTGELCSRNSFLYFLKRIFIIIPSESFHQSFFLGSGKIKERNGFIICKSAYRCSWIFSPLILLYHFLNNFCNSDFIFFFRILFVEDTVFFIA